MLHLLSFNVMLFSANDTMKQLRIEVFKSNPQFYISDSKMRLSFPLSTFHRNLLRFFKALLSRHLPLDTQSRSENIKIVDDKFFVCAPNSRESFDSSLNCIRAEKSTME